MSVTSSPVALWQTITQAGGVRAYIDAQLKERGYLVERRDADEMSDREKDRYKKELKQESAERKKLNKDAWAAYKTAHVVSLGDGVWWHDDQKEDKWDTPNSEERAAENELPALDTPKQLAEALGLSVLQLRGLCYHRDAATKIHYTRFSIPKRDGTERPIWAPMKVLKRAQRWVLLNIAERLPVHGAAHGFLAGRSTATNAAAHADSRLVLKMDIEGFFPTITWRRVKGVFRRAGYRERISTLLALLCTESPREIVELDGKKYFVSLGPRCLPQGAPTSPALTNALCLRLDRRLTGLAAKMGWRYTRYADDLTFSLPAAAPDTSPDALIKLVTKIAAGEGLKIKAEKTRLARSGRRQTVTGLVVNRELPPRAPRALRKQIRAAIHNLKAGKPLPEGESLARLQGYAAYIHMTDPKLGRKFLDELAGIG
jgi:RNA-directed DNA polymerase